ncbi:hypothetical protein ACFVGN_43190, partial [Streptomyces sp. NPDC057757]
MELIVHDHAPVHISVADDALGGAAQAAQEAIRLAFDCEFLGWHGYWTDPQVGVPEDSRLLASMTAAVATAAEALHVGVGTVLPPPAGGIPVSTGYG